MSLITQRPQHWNSVVGQDRAVRVLKAILNSDEFLLRGFIFEGIRGVGKTTTAYLAARALMCKGNDFEGCDKCPSCKTIIENKIDAHPDFLEVDGASKAGVAEAREILVTTESLPVLGKRRIIMIDEAHCLSPEAWKVYLKPLEQPNTDAIFMFISNKGYNIPEEIRSRCCRLKFGRISADVILGYLANVATANHIQYELEALKVIAKASKGIMREAVKALDTCAAIGTVTKELVLNVLDTDLEDAALKILSSTAAKDQETAIKFADEILSTEAPTQLIEAMFATYAKCVYRPETQEQIAIRNHFPDVAVMTRIFLKWTAVSTLSADVIPLLIVELRNLGEIQVQSYSAGSYQSPVERDASVVGVSEFAELTGAKLQRS
jgi:DNA polymerase III subunit gamma/tau